MEKVFNYREYEVEDDHCWWCGKPIQSTDVRHIDVKSAVFCSIDCENRWYRHLRHIEDRFQEWDD